MDLSELPDTETSHRIQSRFEEIQDDLFSSNSYSLIKAIMKLIGASFWNQAICVLISTLCSFVGPICLVNFFSSFLLLY